ncbi:MAG TPA: hypothetical protein VE733_27650 [Streptosporangiaceae bacterium]|nr:hypothetical protein [Streptosporangiaceae bacterium]
MDGAAAGAPPAGAAAGALPAGAAASVLPAGAAAGGPPAADHTDTGGRPTAGGAAGPFDGLAGCSDSELIGLIRGWRKQAALAAAGELAAVAELCARRHAQAKAAGEWDSTAINATCPAWLYRQSCCPRHAAAWDAWTSCPKVPHGWSSTPIR